MFNYYEEEAAPCDVVNMENVQLPMERIFFEQGSVQHTEGGWKGNRGLQFHLYLFFEILDLKRAVAFAYADSMKRILQNKRKDIIGDVDPLYLVDDNKSADYSMYSNMASVEITGDGDENSALDLESDNLIDAPIEED